MKEHWGGVVELDLLNIFKIIHNIDLFSPSTISNEEELYLPRDIFRNSIAPLTLVL